jgi:hypothetical protein
MLLQLRGNKGYFEVCSKVRTVVRVIFVSLQLQNFGFHPVFSTAITNKLSSFSPRAKTIKKSVKKSEIEHLRVESIRVEEHPGAADPSPPRVSLGGRHLAKIKIQRIAVREQHGVMSSPSDDYYHRTNSGSGSGEFYGGSNVNGNGHHRNDENGHDGDESYVLHLPVGTEIDDFMVNSVNLSVNKGGSTPAKLDQQTVRLNLGDFLKACQTNSAANVLASSQSPYPRAVSTTNQNNEFNVGNGFAHFNGQVTAGEVTAAVGTKETTGGGFGGFGGEAALVAAAHGQDDRPLLLETGLTPIEPSAHSHAHSDLDSDSDSRALLSPYGLLASPSPHLQLSVQRSGGGGGGVGDGGGNIGGRDGGGSMSAVGTPFATVGANGSAAPTSSTSSTSHIPNSSSNRNSINRGTSGLQIDVAGEEGQPEPDDPQPSPRYLHPSVLNRKAPVHPQSPMVPSSSLSSSSSSAAAAGAGAGVTSLGGNAATTLSAFSTHSSAGHNSGSSGSGDRTSPKLEIQVTEEAHSPPPAPFSVKNVVANYQKQQSSTKPPSAGVLHKFFGSTFDMSAAAKSANAANASSSSSSSSSAAARSGASTAHSHSAHTSGHAHSGTHSNALAHTGAHSSAHARASPAGRSHHLQIEKVPATAAHHSSSASTSATAPASATASTTTASSAHASAWGHAAAAGRAKSPGSIAHSTGSGSASGTETGDRDRDRDREGRPRKVLRFIKYGDSTEDKTASSSSSRRAGSLAINPFSSFYDDFDLSSPATSGAYATTPTTGSSGSGSGARHQSHLSHSAAASPAPSPSLTKRAPWCSSAKLTSTEKRRISASKSSLSPSKVSLGARDETQSMPRSGPPFPSAISPARLLHSSSSSGAAAAAALGGPLPSRVLESIGPYSFHKVRNGPEDIKAMSNSLRSRSSAGGSGSGGGGSGTIMRSTAPAAGNTGSSSSSSSSNDPAFAGDTVSRADPSKEDEGDAASHHAHAHAASSSRTHSDSSAASPSGAGSLSNLDLQTLLNAMESGGDHVVLMTLVHELREEVYIYCYIVAFFI